MAADRSRITHVLLALVLLALLAVIGMLANDARGGPLDPVNPPASTDGVRLPGTPVSGSTTITSPGYYYATRDLTNAFLVINASDVTLDLGGFTMTKSPPIGGTAISVAPGVLGVAVRNGGIVGYQAGVSAPDSQVRVSDMYLRANGVGAVLGGSSIIERCIVLQNNTGIEIVASLSTVRECEITLQAFVGIRVENGANGTLVEHSSIKSNNTGLIGSGGGLIFFGGSRGTIRGNDFDFNAGADLAFSVQVPAASYHTVIDNVFGCPTNVQVGVNNYVPINTADPHTNRTHYSPC